MRVLFRVDASLQMGAGHVMRCLTLANWLRQEEGAETLFVMRDHPGHLGTLVRDHGHAVTLLEASAAADPFGAGEVDAWLGVPWPLDAAQTGVEAERFRPHWLVVDHYSLDVAWERQLSAPGRRMLVIDDLADRAHDCDLLLDQTFGLSEERYRPWTAATTRRLCGAEYALLRPEFAAQRAASLARRESTSGHRILISMGGMDHVNATGRVLQALKACSLPGSARIVVVMGRTAPWKEAVTTLADTMPWQTEVRVDVRDMATLMGDSDWAIGAAGSSIWERCCLGLPALMVVVADNQRQAAARLLQAGAVLGVMEDDVESRLPQVVRRCVEEPEWLRDVSRVCREITDGLGAVRVIRAMNDVQKRGRT